MITLEQVLAFRGGEELHAGPCTITVGPRGGETLSQERWRMNGRLKTWKTRPGEFQLPIKHGLKTCAYLTHDNAHMMHVASECTPIRREGK